MKTTLLSFLLPAIFLSFLLTACKKDPTKNAKLPPITQEGKNTIGFTIDGEVWVPYYKCKFMGDPCGEISARVGESRGGPPNGIGISCTRLRNSGMSYLIISTSLYETISTIGDKTDSTTVIFVDEGSVGNSKVYMGPARGSKFVITKFDYQNQIISGEFEFVLREQNGSGNTITLNDGLFDFKFNACNCNR